jgi:hypothetical protein
MKKYTLFLGALFILSLICFGFLGFSVKSVNAYDSGCIGSGLYSITTGQYCGSSQNYYNNNNNYSYGCTSAGPYNTITGQLCYGSQYNTTYPYNTYPYNNGYNQSSYYNYAPVISSITPISGSTGTQVTIYGSGFSMNGCTSGYCNNNLYYNNNSNSYSQDIINFGPSTITNAYSTNNGTSLTFTVPSYTNTNSACSYSTSYSYSNSSCNIPQYPIVSGTYPVFVTNANGISNVINFVVTYPTR